MVIDLRPTAILSIGITGHRKLISGTDVIEETIVVFLTSLRDALLKAKQGNEEFFSSGPAKLRFVAMAAEGADLIGISAAAKCGFDIACVLPFPWSDYRADFQPANISVAEAFLANASSTLELPGRREEGPRAYERANEVILENIDLLIAVWDGERARGRAGTGDMVQRAVTIGLPVVVIDPKEPATPTILEAPDDRNLAPTRAEDLSRKAVPSDLVSMVSEIVCPPTDKASRLAIRDLFAEAPDNSKWRYEYRLLLRLLARDPKLKSGQPALGILPSSVAVGPEVSAITEVSALDERQRVIDGYAVDYGHLFRSSTVSKYLLVIVGTLIASIVWLLVPWLSKSAVTVQAVVNVLVLLDTALSSKRRWQERWLEYRVIAQRLVWIRLLRVLGLGAGSVARERKGRSNNSWANWYVYRIARGLGPPTSSVNSTYLASAASLLQGYITQQIRYHRSTLRRLGVLEVRLSRIASGALIAAVLVAALLGIAFVRSNSLEGIRWEPVAIVLLTVLPATMIGLHGLSAEMDLIRLIERSSQTVVLLTRINRALSSAPVTYDRLSAGGHRLTTIMDRELKEWRFVLESRRARTGRNLLKRSKRFRWRPFS